MRSKHLLFVWVSGMAVLLAGALPSQAQEDVRISEFLASNTRGLQDENGDYSDWIEIYNASTSSVNLLDWALTDNAGNLTKWRFPATNIAPSQFIVIFASGKDRHVAGARLHTNFKLSAGGDYLALVRPDGSIATQFAPTFPPQAPDVSFGFASFSSTSTAVATNAPVRWRIPNGTEGAWTGTNYDDSGWTVGTNGLGYGSFPAADYSLAVLPTAPVIYYRMNEGSGGTAANAGSGGAAQNGTYNGVTLGTAGPQPPQFNGFEANNNAPTFNGTSSFVAGPPGFLSGRNAFTVGGWIKPAGAQAARTGLFGQNDAVEFGFIDAATLQCYTANGSVNATYTVPANVWVHVVAVCNGSTLRILTNGVQAASGSSTGSGTSSFNFNVGGGGVFDATGNFFNGQIDEVVGYARALSDAEILGLYQAGTNGVGAASSSLIRTDVAVAMSNVNASAYVRIPFVVSNANNISLVALRMQYNDGFVASINGVEAVRVNAPDPLSATSAATNVHSSVVAEEFRLGTGTLVSGTNILAIQGLNIAANDTNFFVGAELVLTSVEADSPTPVYFTVPTPGAANVGGIANPGPAVLNATNSPLVPLDSQDLVVSAKIVPTFYAVSNVVLRYRIMFSNEVEVQMYDDGTHGDTTSGDGVYATTIPENLSTNGQMIRWFFRATDVRGNTSRWPLFPNPAESAEYLGTVVNPTNVTSKLPIYHIFAPTTVLSPGPTTTQTGADSQAGGKVSIFYDGEFYDNVTMNLRGNSTAGFNKKAHHVNFNREHPFRHTGPGGRIVHTSFTAEYPDPSYMRQYLTFWLSGQMGGLEPFYYPVRLQLNGVFYQLVSHNDVVGADQMQRFGFDPSGALYKAAGTVVPAQFSTGVFEKKTRLNEPNTDYLALTTGLNETNSVGQRRTNVFDMLDLPEVMNYLVTARWGHENDDVWANMTLYRDTLGDKMWRIIPFDMNLSWGAIFYEGSTPSVIEGVQATNDIHKAHPLYGSSAATALSGPGAPNNYNRMYDAIFNVPETRQMFLRRMRTLLDTHIKPIGTPQNSTVVEQLIYARRDLIAEEAINDRAKWGWPPKGGQCNFDPGINLTNGVSQMISNFLYLRRIHFYGKHSVTNTALPIGIGKDQNAGIPLAQPPNATIHITGVEFNPSSGNQAEEYLCITNPTPFALDISGWKLSGAIDFTFAPGTVIPSNNVIYVSPNVVAFRARATSPRGGQGLFVVGPYKGQLSARGESLRITDDIGRLVETNGYAGNPSLAQQFLRITELMYHPAPLDGNTNGPEEFEYIELKNISPSVTLNLTGVRFTNGVDFNFTGSAVTSLAPGASVLIVKNLAAFTARYGALANIAGVYNGYLDNAGERIQLIDASGEEILDFSYNNTWYPMTDGLGFSLVVVNEQAEPDAWDSKSNWRESGQLSGSPGSPDPAPPAIVPVLVNEVLSRTDFPPPTDTIELYNPTGISADLSGWYLTDDFATPKKYRIPDGTILPGGSYRIFNESQFNPNPGVPPSFALSGDNDEVYLFSAATNGVLTGYFHGFHFGAAEDGVSLGRYVSSEGKEHFVAQVSRTLGTNNAGPKVGPIVINEIMYHPPEVGVNDNTDDEFIELLNISGGTVQFYDNAPVPNPWKISGGIDYAFPNTFTLGAGQFALLVNFNPTNASMLAAFRAKYGVGPAIAVLGPYNGKLNNAGDDIKLSKPTTPLNAAFPYVEVDRVEFKDGAPWPEGADGFGLSLQRKSSTAFGNDPVNWVAALPTAAGATPGAATLPTLTSQPASQTVLGSTSLTLAVSANGDAPLRYQWRVNGTNVAGATNSALQISSVMPQNAGDYQVLVYNNAGSTVSTNATITVILGASIIVQPQNMTVLRGSNPAFSVVAFSSAALSYQWKRNGVDIPGATNASYTIPNVQQSDEGDYSVTVSDAFGTIPSSVAHLTVYSNVGWRFATLTGNIGSASNSIGTNLLIFMSAAGEAYIDDISLVPLSGPNAGVNIITNGDFEGPLSSGPWTIPPTMPSSAITNTFAHSGAYSLHVVATNGGSTVNSIKQLLPALNTNIFCTLSFWYRTSTSGGVLNVRTFPGSALSLSTNITATDMAPIISSQPKSLNIGGGTDAQLSVAAFGSEPFFYQWSKDGVALTNGGRISGATSSTLTISQSRTSDSGNYSVRVSNVIGATNSTTAAVTVVGDPPLITAQPQSQQVPCQANVTFTVAASGDAPLTYQWRFNATAILNATNTSLTLTNVNGSASGPYSVAVTNGLGGVISSNAVLVVEDNAVASLTVQRQDTNLVVSWPKSCATYQLQETATLSPPNWAPVSAPPQSNGAQWTATIPIGNGNRFYRLRN